MATLALNLACHSHRADAWVKHTSGGAPAWHDILNIAGISHIMLSLLIAFSHIACTPNCAHKQHLTPCPCLLTECRQAGTQLAESTATSADVCPHSWIICTRQSNLWLRFSSLLDCLVTYRTSGVMKENGGK